MIAAPPALAGPDWRTVRGAVTPALEGELTPAEARRLLKRRSVREALVATFDGWDGRDDHVRVGRTEDGEIAVEVVIGDTERVCTARLSPGEGGASEPVCTDERKTDRRTALLGRDLWRAPRRARPKPKAPEDETLPPPPEHVDTVLRRKPPRDPADDFHPEVYRALVAWTDFKDGLGPGWKDPFLPKKLWLAADALRPAAAFEPLVEEAVTADLRNPFSEARMGAKLHLPATSGHALSRDRYAAPLVGSLDQACRVAYANHETHAAPPSLDCFRRVTQHRVLEGKAAYQVRELLSSLGFAFSVPVLDNLVMLDMEDAASRRVHQATWPLVWLAWIQARPDGVADAVAALTREERLLIRRRLWRWWIKPGLETYRPLITRLYERHFVDLYPEARDAAGMPRRDFFSTTWLWASNWLSVADQRPVAAITAAYERLDTRQRAVIDGFVADQLIASRFPASVAALKAHARN